MEENTPLNDKDKSLKKKNKYAFPSLEVGLNDNGGLTKREYIAIEAMNGILSGNVKLDGGADQDAIAKAAYLVADSMIKHGENSSPE